MTESAPAVGSHRLCCTFWLASHRFGIEAQAVREISAHTACTPIPLAPPAVRGYVNLRGHLYLALDLRSLLHLPAAAASIPGYLIVLQAGAGESLAVFVDQIDGTVAVREEDIDWPQDGGGDMGPALVSEAPAEDLVEGTARLDDGLLTILAPSRFLAAMARGVDGGRVLGG